MSLLTIGSVAFDTIETPFGKAERIVGGACTYISMAAAYFIKDIKLSAVVGDDFPKSELDYLTSRGVDLAGLQIKKGEKSQIDVTFNSTGKMGIQDKTITISSNSKVFL